MSDLPAGWHLATVGELATSLVDGPFGSNLKSEHYVPSGARVIRLQNIGDGHFDDGDKVYVPIAHAQKLRRHEATAGDVLIAAMGDVLPRTCLVPSGIEPAIVKADCFRLRPEKGVLSPFLAYALSAPQVRRIAATQIAGIGRPRLNLRKVSELLIRLPPTAEQERIVAAIEEQLSRLDAGAAALERARQNLKRMRAAVLESAVRGHLVQESPRGSTTPGARPGELPPGWEMVDVGDIAEVSGGITKNPKRVPKVNPVPFLRVANVQRDGLDLREVHEIEIFAGELERLRLRAGDLLVVEGNGSLDQIGRSALWDGSIDPCVHQNHLIRVRPGREVMPEYLNLFWNAPSSTAVIQGAASSTSGLHTLSTGKVRRISVALPPLDAQHKIVSEVERQMSLLGALESTLTAEMPRCGALRSTILAAAYSGNLVPQDPTDEPASVLLQRITAERASNGQRSTRKPRTLRRKAPA